MRGQSNSSTWRDLETQLVPHYLGCSFIGPHFFPQSLPPFAVYGVLPWGFIKLFQKLKINKQTNTHINFLQVGNGKLLCPSHCSHLLLFLKNNWWQTSGEPHAQTKCCRMTAHVTWTASASQMLCTQDNEYYTKSSDKCDHILPPATMKCIDYI